MNYSNEVVATSLPEKSGTKDTPIYATSDRNNMFYGSKETGEGICVADRVVTLSWPGLSRAYKKMEFSIYLSTYRYGYGEGLSYRASLRMLNSPSYLKTILSSMDDKTVNSFYHILTGQGLSLFKSKTVDKRLGCCDNRSERFSWLVTFYNARYFPKLSLLEVIRELLRPARGEMLDENSTLSELFEDLAYCLWSMTRQNKDEMDEIGSLLNKLVNSRDEDIDGLFVSLCSVVGHRFKVENAFKVGEFERALEVAEWSLERDMSETSFAGTGKSLWKQLTGTLVEALTFTNEELTVILALDLLRQRITTLEESRFFEVLNLPDSCSCGGDYELESNQ